jgi:hypothetical protein
MANNPYGPHRNKTLNNPTGGGQTSMKIKGGRPERLMYNLGNQSDYDAAKIGQLLNIYEEEELENLRPTDELGRFTDVKDYVPVNEFLEDRANKENINQGLNIMANDTEFVEHPRGWGAEDQAKAAVYGEDVWADWKKRTQASDNKQQELLADKDKKPGLLGSIMDFFTRGGAKIKDLMTDDKGLFQGGESDRIFGRLRDLLEPKAEINTQNVLEKTPGSQGVSIPGLPKKIIKTDSPDNPNYARYERVDQAVQPGQNVIYGGISTGYKPLKIVDRPLTPQEHETAKIAMFIKENPNATRDDIRKLEQESRQKIQATRRAGLYDRALKL